MGTPTLIINTKLNQNLSAVATILPLGGNNGKNKEQATQPLWLGGRALV